MSRLFGTIKNLWESRQRTDEASDTVTPFQLKSGATVVIDSVLPLLLRDHSPIEPFTQESVWSVGIIDLGQSTYLHRFYFDDEDYWLQVLSHGQRDAQGEDLILFVYEESLSVTSETELKRLAGPQSDIGLPEYEYDGCTFYRQWGSEEGQTELVPLAEQVRSPEEHYKINHLSMLYARDIDLTDRREFLLFSVEEDADGNISITTSRGVTLMPSDIQVI
ncbi:DUF2491 family protein [Zymobacter palmae]|uniref:DNA-directed RNA polymerase, sigma subunit n=1 Tax=Zymobacter palmae TaxID=33074 RepID=A0A348HES4_9GAMM|nr:DUF2491 family protein [Zymobacter palmae]BBG30126.1 DNA-directed RNA polymerase, sigma subunit [Zymobacter palmae]